MSFVITTTGLLASGYALDSLPVYVVSVLAGVSSTLVYQLLLPHSQLRKLDQSTAEVRAALSQHDMAFSQALPLLRESVTLAVQRLGFSLIPSLAAAVPMVALLVAMDYWYADQTIIHFGPQWARSFLAVFIVLSTVSALVTKLAVRNRETDHSYPAER